MNLAGATGRDKVADFYCNFKVWKTRITEVLCDKFKVRREVIEEKFLVPKGNHSVIENTMYPWHLHAECFFLFWIACVVSCEKETKDILFMMNKSHIIITGA